VQEQDKMYVTKSNTDIKNSLGGIFKRMQADVALSFSVMASNNSKKD